MTGAARRDHVLRYVLDRQAAERPEAIYALFQEGETWTFAEVRDRAARFGQALWSLGVRPGHRVLSWQPNCATALLAWFGSNWIGASCVPVNTAYRGTLLQHVIDNSGADLIIGHPDLIPRLSEISVARPATVIPTGPISWHDDRFRVLGPENLESGTGCDGDAGQPIEPWDEQSIIFTSGTTGPSKGVLSSYLHLATTALVSLGPLDAPGMRWLLQMPLFHVGGTVIAYGMLLLGRSIAVVDRFRTERFWQDVDRMNCTNAVVGGAMVSFLLRQPARPDDRNHALRYALIVPFNEQAMEFRRRFGVDVQTHYNMSETSVPILSEMNPSTPGHCGRVRPGIEARIVDAHDFEVAPGQVGELVLRAEQPWTMSHGYNAMPEATAAAWRNGWFHTGDALRKDAEGRFHFVDRVKDAIRRRGENISSFDVEAEVLTHPSVREVAAIPVPSEHGEHEVMIVVAPAPDQAIDPRTLFDFLRARMTHFMLPRYIRIVAELPRTPTEKVRKFELRRDGVTADTWDREAAGIRVKRDL